MSLYICNLPKNMVDEDINEKNSKNYFLNTTDSVVVQ